RFGWGRPGHGRRPLTQTEKFPETQRKIKGGAVMSGSTLENHKVVSPAEWLAARRKLLAKEKQYTHMRDSLSRERRELPWVKLQKSYVFDAPTGKKTLAELFDGRSQLVIYHFMFAPEWNEGCPSCSMIADGFDGALPHIRQRDVSFTAVSRAPLA